MILMDPDIVADPHDLKQMHHNVEAYPDTAQITEHILWPATTHHDDWVWAFGPVENGKAILTQNFMKHPQWIANGFTYWPRRLLDIALPHMPYFDPLTEDINLSRFARENGIIMRVITAPGVKHVHFTRGDDYLAWTRQP